MENANEFINPFVACTETNSASSEKDEMVDIVVMYKSDGYITITSWDKNTKTLIGQKTFKEVK